MKAIAVRPGEPDSAHIAELEKPTVDSIPDGKGVLVRVLKVGVDANIDAYNMDVTITYNIIGVDLPAQELSFVLIPTR